MRQLTPATTGRSTRRLREGQLVVAALVAAAVSLVVPAAMGYDPWAWLLWGREITGLGLDTTRGPSWKPLPVVVTTVLAPLGDAAPVLWLVLCRASAVLALVLAHRLGRRFAGPVAGLTAAGLLVLAPDPDPRFVRLLLEGHTGIPAATFTLWAIDRHLDGHRRHALLLGTAVALIRPEAWPFLGLYAGWLWRREPAARPLVAGAVGVVPVLWFGGDWWGSGHPWHGANTAQVTFADTTNRTELALRRFAETVVVPAWIAASAAVAVAWRRREPTIPVLGVAALAWMGLVVAMTVLLRYASLSRFFLPGAAVVCVLAGVGVVLVARSLPSLTSRRVFGVLAAALALPFVVPRAVGVVDVLSGVADRAQVEAELPEVLDRAGGARALLACGEITVHGRGSQRPAVAWHLSVPLSRIDTGPLEGPGVVLTSPANAPAATAAAPSRVLADGDHWIVTAVGCAATDPTD